MRKYLNLGTSVNEEDHMSPDSHRQEALLQSLETRNMISARIRQKLGSSKKKGNKQPFERFNFKRENFRGKNQPARWANGFLGNDVEKAEHPREFIYELEPGISQDPTR